MKLRAMTEAWFSMPDDPDGTEFKIKHLRSGEIAEITSQVFKHKIELNGENNTPVIEHDSLKERELVFVYAVTDWKEVYASDGGALECTEENKLRLCRELDEDNFAELMSFIGRSRKILADQVRGKDEADTKN